MRVLLRLEAMRDSPYELSYYRHGQGFVYSLLRGTSFESLHDKRGYKFFCFSNVFPPADLKKGDRRTFIISSPNAELVDVVSERLRRFVKEEVRVCFGRMIFLVRGVEVLRPQVGVPCELVTGTPIVVRIPQYRYAEYGIDPPKSYRYVFWRAAFQMN